MVQAGNAFGNGPTAMSRDGRLLLTADQFDDLRLWDVATATLLRRFPDTGEQNYKVIKGLDFLRDADAFLVWYRNKARSQDDLTLWDTRGGNVIRTFVPCEASQISTMALSRGGRRAVIACNKGGIALWDVETGALVRSLLADHPGRAAPADVVAISPDGRAILVSWKDPVSSRWETASFDAESGGKTCTMPDQRPALSCLVEGDRRYCQMQAARQEAGRVFSLDGRGVLLLDAGGGDAIAWDVGRCVATARSAPPGPVVAASARNPRALSRMSDSSLVLWDVATGIRLATWPRGDPGDRQQALDFSADGGLVIIKADGSGAYLWSTIDGTSRFIPQSRFKRNFQFASDGQSVLSAEFDYPVRLWQGADHKAGREAENKAENAWREISLAGNPNVSRLSFGPNSRYLQVASGSRVVQWDLDTGQGTLADVAMSPAHGAVVSRDGRWKAVESRDENGGVELRDGRSGALLVTLHANQSPTSGRAETLALAPDGRFVTNTDPRRVLALVRGTSILRLDDYIRQNQRASLTELLGEQATTGP
ncbi:WD40 repeat domain-containing protein [Labrys portucalensis]|uniref:WD40 repeat domain-containing protein n=1 Tax=Labrys neptuniae TaxID=376174 RepID=A0ABV6Z8P9_9HYPH